MNLESKAKAINFAAACVVVAVGAAFASASYAYGSNLGDRLPLASFPGSKPSTVSEVTAPAPAGSPLAPEIAVLTRQGISPARAIQALRLQQQVAETHLTDSIEAALAGAYAGVWFEPAAAQFHVGVTSNASRQAVRRVVAQAGLTANVVETPVRSTWAALIAAQNHWNKRLAQLLASAQAMTGIDPRHNAVSVTLSSSVPPSERALLEHEATTASVTVAVGLAPPPELRLERKAKKTCKAPFEKEEAYCEETITSGVNLEIGGKPQCTAGPMLIQGNETFLLTAGHCFVKGAETPKAGEAIKEESTSAFPGVAGQKEIGKEGYRYNLIERDTAEIRVKRPGPFTEALPVPVPALMAEWVEKPKTPGPVGGDLKAETGQVICHEGMVSGEHCGEVAKLNATGAGTEHVVEVTACSDHGDSGGPYFVRTETGEVLMEGTEVGGPLPDCNEKGVYKSYFEPLLDLTGAAGFGILSTFRGQELLTTANETRKEPAAGPFWQVKGSKLPQGTSKKIVDSLHKPASLYASLGGKWIKITCETGKSAGSIFNGTQHGESTDKIEFSKCLEVEESSTGKHGTYKAAGSCKIEEPLIVKTSGSLWYNSTNLYKIRTKNIQIAFFPEKVNGAFAMVVLNAGCGALAGEYEMMGDVAAEPSPQYTGVTAEQLIFPTEQQDHLWQPKNSPEETQQALHVGKKEADLLAESNLELESKETLGVIE